MSKGHSNRDYAVHQKADTSRPLLNPAPRSEGDSFPGTVTNFPLENKSYSLERLDLGLEI